MVAVLGYYAGMLAGDIGTYLLMVVTKHQLPRRGDPRLGRGDQLPWEIGISEGLLNVPSGVHGVFDGRGREGLFVSINI